MPIQANVTNNQITATVGETQIDVSVNGGVGPTGSTGPSGTVSVSAPITNAGTSTAAVIGLATGTGLEVTGGTLAVQYGTTSSVACRGSDARLSDSREWSAPTVTQADAEAGSSTDRRAFSPLRIFQAIAAWWAGSASKAKLDGIAAGATANATDAQLRDRATHTGTQTASTISDFTTAVVAAAPPTTNASLLTTGTLPDARLSANIARTSDVSSAVAALVNSAPAALDTLGELATALGSDANFSTTVTNALASKAPINNPTFTGTVGGITKGMVGLGNVDNTSDANKPISAATQAALDGKAASSHAHGSITSDGKIGSVAGKAIVTGEAGVLQASDYVANASFLYDTTDDNGPMFAIQDADPYWSPTAIEAGTPGKLRVSIGAAAVSHAHAVADITGLATVAVSGSYTDLSNRPTLATVATSGSAADLSGTLNAARLPATTVTAGSYGSASSVGTFTVDATGRLTAAGSTAIAISAGAVSGLANVATSGSYNDLTNKPTIPSAYTLPTASATVLGGVKIGSGLSIDGSSVLSTTYSYTLPNATTSTLGGVIVGTGLGVTSGTVSVSYGTTSGTACQGNDSRLSDARTPTSHASTHASGGSDALSLAASQITSGTIATARLGSGTANSTTVLKGDQTYGRISQVFEFTKSTAPADATGSAGNWTWTIPANATAVEFFMVGGGGGGGSGRRGAAGTVRFGGGGGAGGCVTLLTRSVAELSTRTLGISVGAGGAGGAAVTANDTNGNNGGLGAITGVTFGSQTFYASRGNGGGGGSATAGTSGTANTGLYSGTAGAASSATSTPSGVNPTSSFVPSGGGAGGGISSGDVSQNGSIGRASWYATGDIVNANGGTAPGGNGQSAAAAYTSPFVGCGGAGGGGAAGNASVAGGSGGDGSNYGGGGGGGGASVNGFNSGAGGNGGDGFVRITVWY